MGQTQIEWTDRTWNPVVGCTKVSAGCKNCYAKTLHDQRHKARLAGKAVPAQYAKPFEEVQLMPDRLRDPLSWRKPQRVFVNSVSDLFHEDIPDEFVVKCFAVMLLAQRHTFQVLTKRPKRMRRVLAAPNFGECVYDMAFDLSHQWTIGWEMDRVPDVDVLPNVWIGTSVENQAAADERIPHLLATPAAVRFLSCEPLLGEVDLRNVGKTLRGYDWDALLGWRTEYQYKPRNASECGIGVRSMSADYDGTKFNRVDWIIVGGESGPGARPMELAWGRSLVRQCKTAGVPVFVKQLGSCASDPENGIAGRALDVPAEAAPLISLRLKDAKGGDPEEWPADLRVREFPKAA